MPNTSTLPAALAEVDEYGGVTLLSRRAKPLAAAFPEIVHGVHEVAPARTVLDGEIVRWAGGRLDFAALQRRHTARGSAVAAGGVERVGRLVRFVSLTGVGHGYPSLNRECAQAFVASATE